MKSSIIGFEQWRRSPIVGCVAGLTLAVLSVSSPARCDAESADPALAQALFEQARALMSTGQYPEACAKLAESHRLDPASGTLLNLAVCHEKQGRTATAWAEYNDVLAISRKDGSAERQHIASARIKDLGPKLCRLTVVAPRGAPSN
ncbi:MAG TPA: tetratricopeptide repeat protein, partial [Polyangiaceae bacterium]|nr:tetratricopeptide repeat protein [Polyangiaceae bacterium]